MYGAAFDHQKVKRENVSHGIEKLSSALHQVASGIGTRKEATAAPYLDGHNCAHLNQYKYA